MTIPMTAPQFVRFDLDAEMELLPEIPASELVSGSPIQHGRTWLDLPEFGVDAGIWSCTAQTTVWMDYPVNEFIVIHEGEITIREDRGETTFRAGDAFVLPKGLHCQWVQPGTVRKAYVIFDDHSGLSNPGPLHAIRIDPDVLLEPAAPPPPEILISGSPVQASRTWFEDVTGQFSAGVWETTAYHRMVVPFPRYELMHPVEGQVTIADDAGRTETFHAGDVFLMPLGALTSWETPGRLKKIFCTFQPTAAASHP
jgi:uncharacterized cupin superfamily protein